MDALERLAWAVSFIQKDLSEPSPGELAELRAGLARFLRPDGSMADVGGVWAIPLELPLPQDYTVDDFRLLQKEMEHVFLGALEHADGASAPQVEIRATCALVPLPVPDRVILHTSGPTRDMALLVLLHLLQQEPLSTFARCPACGKRFVRFHGRQNYCSRTCTLRVNKRDWRARRGTAAPRQAATTTEKKRHRSSKEV